MAEAGHVLLDGVTVILILEVENRQEIIIKKIENREKKRDRKWK